MKAKYHLPLTLLLFVSNTTISETLRIATAANFTAPMKALAKHYTQQSEHKVKLSFGSSGNFYAQLVNGAPYDLFFSADRTKPQKLDSQGIALKGSQFTYAVGRLVLWSADSQLVDQYGKVLLTNSFNKLALADPKLAPYGEAAEEVLRSFKLYKKTQPKHIIGRNISQTYQFIKTGSVDLGFIALSQIKTFAEKEKGSSWVVPQELHSPIYQDAVIIKHSNKQAIAKQFITFLQTEPACAIIRSYGYTLPQ